MTVQGDQLPDTEPGTPLGAHDPRQIGPYLLLRRLGGGGMGTVYLARREGSTWRVALKVIQSALLEHEPQLRDRFAREITHAQRVDGRYTARILDADLHADLPWMATEYVPGPTLETKVANSGPLPLPALMDLACGVSEALAAIHAAGLVHRDLKPGNVILAADGPRVIDFGIAHGDDTTRLTGTGTTIGTLAYMSPEQLGSQTAGPASDMFALGGVLCYAATGHPAFPAGHYGAVIHAVLSGEPTLTDLADPWTRDLVAACLAKDPARRPAPDQVRLACATRLQALTAAPSTEAPVPAATAPMPPPGPTAVASPPTPFAPPPPQHLAPAAPPAVPSSEPDAVPAAAPRGLRSRRRLLLAAAMVPVLIIGYLALQFFVFGGAAISDHVLSGHTNSVNDVAWSPDGDAAATASDDGTVRVWEPDTGYTMTTLLFDTGAPATVKFSPDGDSIATGGTDNTVRLWDAVTGKNLRKLTGHTGTVYAVAFSPDGDSLASASADNTVRLWDAASGNLLRTLTGHTSTVYALAYSRDGKTLASGGSDNTIRLWDATNGTGIRTLEPKAGTVYALAYSRDGKTLASGGSDNTARLWDPATGNQLRTLTGHTSTVYAVAFPPDGKTIATGSGDNTVRIWDPATGSGVRALADHQKTVTSLAYSPDGTALLTGSQDETARIRLL